MLEFYTLLTLEKVLNLVLYHTWTAMINSKSKEQGVRGDRNQFKIQNDQFKMIDERSLFGIKLGAIATAPHIPRLRRPMHFERSHPSSF